MAPEAVMLIDIRKHLHGQPCAILGMGHTSLSVEFLYDNRRFIQEFLSDSGRKILRHDLDPAGQLTTEEWMCLADRKFVSQTGIRTRYIYPGTTADLGSLAARECLRQSGVTADALDAIIVGTNTGTGYPSTADLIKGMIGAPAEAFCCDVQEACPVGAVIVQLGWEKVRQGLGRRVLVVGAEKGSNLASPDDYKSANLFGDAAFAMLLGPAEREQFVFFDSGSDPSNGQADYIARTPHGFRQDGPAVHKYVGQIVPKVMEELFNRLNLDPATVNHLFPHQPSVKTIEFFLTSLRKRWPEFRATVHRNVEDMGNTSGACTGWMISRSLASNQLQPGQFCLVASFGAGMSWGLYGFIV